jgi:hypothetical protein
VSQKYWADCLLKQKHQHSAKDLLPCPQCHPRVLNKRIEKCKHSQGENTINRYKLMPLIPATQEAEIRRIQGQLQKKTNKQKTQRPCLKNS